MIHSQEKPLQGCERCESTVFPTLLIRHSPCATKVVTWLLDIFGRNLWCCPCKSWALTGDSGQMGHFLICLTVASSKGTYLLGVHQLKGIFTTHGLPTAKKKTWENNWEARLSLLHIDDMTANFVQESRVVRDHNGGHWSGRIFAQTEPRQKEKTLAGYVTVCGNWKWDVFIVNHYMK